MVERMLTDFGVAHDLRTIALRYFNAAGADPDNSVGEAHDPETHLIPLVLDAASERRTNITVFGSDYDTPDGTCVRDYIHVTDLAAAHVKALQALNEGHPSDVFNLGNGQGFSVLEVIKAVESVTGLEVPVHWGPRRAGDPPSLVSDASKARARLSWQPQMPSLEFIIGTAWRWHQRAPAIRTWVKAV